MLSWEYFLKIILLIIKRVSLKLARFFYLPQRTAEEGTLRTQRSEQSVTG